MPPDTATRLAAMASQRGGGPITVPLPVRAPFDGTALLEFFAARAVPGVESVAGRSYARTLRLPGGTGVVMLTMPEPIGPANEPAVTATFTLDDPGDLAVAVARCRRLVDADADPRAVAAVLGGDPALAAVVAAEPGLRLPGAVDGPEILMRALVGQQVSVAAARTALGRLTAASNERVASPVGGLTHLFPSPAALATLGEGGIGGPRRRAAAIVAAATDMASGSLTVNAERETGELTAELVARAGIGPWTAGYVAMRVLGDPDVLLTGDLALRHGAAALGLPGEAAPLAAVAERWRPVRSYAGMYLWRACPPPVRTPRLRASRTGPTVRSTTAPNDDTRL